MISTLSVSGNLEESSGRSATLLYNICVLCPGVRLQLDRISTMHECLGSASSRALIIGGVIALSGIVAAQYRRQPAPITIDYPADKSIFPPEITPPLFIWRDPAESNTQWRIDVEFADGSAALHAQPKGERMRIGPIDERCIGPTNKLPELTPQQTAPRTCIPHPAPCAAIPPHDRP